ncbi:MAG: hypothetical protein PUD47_06040 [Bacteroidales bacterium]|nr:hypothetical protein [Bacteroidales bacterium]
MVAFTAVSCSDNDDSENLSPEEVYDYPITGHWVHSLQDEESYLILDLDSDGTGTESKRFHGVMEYEIPILYEYEKGSLTIISDKNGSRTYKCQWMGDNSIALGANSSKREYWDRISKETNIGDGITKYELASLIPKCVSIETEYRNFIWHITIESTLHTVFPNAEFDFRIGHGSVEGLMQTQGEKQVWRCSTSYEGNKKVVKIQNPYWGYYICGKGNNPDIGAEMEVYFMSYEYLLDKGDLTPDEKQFMNDLAEILREHEPEAIANYVIEVMVSTNDKRTSFIRNLRLSDDCK